MKKKLYIVPFLCSVVVAVSCVRKYVCKSEPNLQQVSNEYFDATIAPVFILDGYKGFALTIHNKTSKDLEVDWNKSFYIYDGETQGGFLFPGMRAGDRNKPKPPDIISYYSSLTKEIFPGNLSQFSQIAGATVYEPMKAGENGVHLTIKVEGKEITEKLTLNFTQQ